MADITSTVKTFVLGTDGVTYFEVITVTYDDEGQDVIKRPVGPAIQLTADQADKILQNFTSLANDAARVSRAKKIVLEANTTDDNIFAVTALRPLDVIQARFQAELLAAGWTIDNGAGALPIVFTVNAQGVLRYNVNATGAKNAKIYGDVIRLINYPSSPTDTEFFLNDKGNRYYSLPNRAVTIHKP